MPNPPRRRPQLSQPFSIVIDEGRVEPIPSEPPTWEPMEPATLDGLAIGESEALDTTYGEVLRLREELEYLNDQIEDAENAGNYRDVDMYADQARNVRRRIGILEGRTREEQPSNNIITAAHSRFLDFWINQQKTQIGMVGDRENRRSFSVNVQTNRGSYNRRFLQIAWTTRGLVFRRVPVRLDMSHGFKLVHRQATGDFTILERKEEPSD
jgi:hypothetical protein